MADESPPPKKIGSLRDRIAAFEKQSSPGNAPSNPPPTRPKPGNISWKPKQPSPPPSPSNKDKDRTTPSKSSMSASDAKDSIGQGISLKERMAALQGKGGFGSATPPPKPTAEKPKWKPPPKPVTSPSPTEEKPPVDFEAVVRSPPLESEPAETPAEKPTESSEQDNEGDEVKDDPEEEERQRRAAIAARMQRLGGARIGMSPPVVAPKPSIRRTSVPKEEGVKPEVTSPPVAEDASKERGEPQRRGSKDSVDKLSEVVPTSNKPPTSMPVPAAPRRAAPPRRKKETPKPSDEAVATQHEEEAAIPEAKVPLPESTSNLLADAEGEKAEQPYDLDPKSVPTMEPSPLPVKDEPSEPAKDSGLVTERSTSPTLVKPGDHDDVPKDAPAPAPQEGQPTSLLSEKKLAEIVEEGKKEIEELCGIDQPERDAEKSLNEVWNDEEPIKPLDTGAEKEAAPKVLTADPDVGEHAEDKSEEQLEEDEDEATRRARIAERLAKSGGFNPFAGGPPVRKPSESSLPERRTSVESPGPFKPTLHEEQEPPAQPLARMDADSTIDEAGLLGVKTEEDDKPLDIIERAEDNYREPDENEILNRGVPIDNTDVNLVKAPAPPPFTVPPPPPLTSRPVPPVQHAPESTIPVIASKPIPTPRPPSPPQITSRSPEERPDSSVDEEPGPPPPLPPGRPSGVPPPTAPRPVPRAETQEFHEVPSSHTPAPFRVARAASHESEEYEEEPSTTSFDLPRYMNTTSQSQERTGQPDPPELEILADEDGDPIDPGFIPSRSPSMKSVKPPTEPPMPPQEELVPESAPEEVDEEQARKRRLAERMAKLGGIRFGAPPPTGIPLPQKVQRGVEAEGEREEPKEEEQPEEEDEQARRQRITAKLAGMGGMRIGMVPGATPPSPPAPARKGSTNKEQPERRSSLRSPPPVRALPSPVQTSPPPVRSDTGNASEDDVVKVEMEESEAEEVDYHKVREEAPPPVPSRMSRPPIPGSGHFRKSSTDSVTFPSLNTAPSRFVPPTSSEYVMVEEPDVAEGPIPPPPPRPARPPRTAPPPPAPPSDVPDSMTMSQWELPPIPRSSLDMETSVVDLSASSWSGSFDTEETSQEKPREASMNTRRQSGSSMTSDQLTAAWGRVGIQVCEGAVELFEKSKKTLVGDGSFVGFINAVLDRVPNASTVEEDATSFGYLIYAQTGSSVTKRAADIMPGDIITLSDAKLKGHKGIQTYHQNVGEGTPVVAVVGEYEPKKSKIKAYQASQHVGNQTVESISYRLEDLKSGSIKVYRVLES